MARTIMLTGATGYLGGAVARHLLDAGHAVRALVRDPARLDLAAGDRLAVVRGDLLDPASLEEAVRGADAVVHTAALTSDWAPDLSAFERVNVDGTRNVLRAAREAGVPRVLHTSTVMVFGPTDGLDLAHERTARPARAFFLPYQRTKASAAELCRRARDDDLDVRIVYPGALYGPGRVTEGNYLAGVMQNLVEGRFPLLPRTAGRRWCLAHVDDVARGHLLALEHEERNREFILGGDNVAFDRMLEIMRDGLALPSLPPRVPGPVMLAGLALLCCWSAICGSRPPISFGGGRGLLHEWAFDSSRASRELGYEWRPFEPAFAEFVAWYAGLKRPGGAGARPAAAG